MIHVNLPTQKNSIIVLYGPMFASKTTTLIHMAQDIGERALIVKPSIDDRFDQKNIVTHDGNFLQAIPLKQLDHVKKLVQKDTKAVLIDEGHLFGESIVDLCDWFRSHNLLVVIALVDHDHQGFDYDRESWVRLAGDRGLRTNHLIHLADIGIRLSARCSVCGEIALRFKRVISGRLGPDDPYVWVAGGDVYKPLCRIHFEQLCKNKFLRKLSPSKD